MPRLTSSKSQIPAISAWAAAKSTFQIQNTIEINKNSLALNSTQILLLQGRKVPLLACNRRILATLTSLVAVPSQLYWPLNRQEILRSLHTQIHRMRYKKHMIIISDSRNSSKYSLRVVIWNWETKRVLQGIRDSSAKMLQHTVRALRRHQGRMGIHNSSNKPTINSNSSSTNWMQ